MAADVGAAEKAAPSCAPPLEPYQCWWTWTGDQPAEEISKSGDQLFRFYFHTFGEHGPFGADDAVFEVRRSPDGRLSLDARQTNTKHREVRHMLPQPVWDRLMERWKIFKRYQDGLDAERKRLEAARQKRQVSGEIANRETSQVDVEVLLNNLPTSCTDSDSIDFDVVIAGKIERRAAAGCPSTADDLFDELSYFLLSQVPGCDRLAQGRQHACFALGGDRIVAANAVAGMAALDGVKCKKRNAVPLSQLFAPDIQLTIEGKLIPAGRAVQGFLDMRCGKRDYLTAYDLIEGEADGGVVVTGRIESLPLSSKGGIFDEAPFRQTWRRDGTSFRIVSWDIHSPDRSAAR